jgi:hypothetical protein
MTKTITKKKRIDITINKINTDYDDNCKISGLIVISSKRVQPQKDHDTSFSKKNDVEDKNLKFRFKQKPPPRRNIKSLLMTKLYLHNNKFFLYKNDNIDECIKTANIKKKDILERICIYEKGNIKLYIIVVDFGAKIKNSQDKVFIDMFEKEDETHIPELYYDKIYFYNKKYRDTHLYYNIESVINTDDLEIDIKLKLHSIYYFLIGYR